MRHRFVTATVACTLAAAAVAAEAVPAPAPVTAPGQAPVPPGPWTISGRAGAFMSNVYANDGAARTTDATLAGTQNSVAWKLTFDYTAAWKAGSRSMDHIVKLRYGRQRTGDQPFSETDDEARYDGVFRQNLAKPTFAYGSWGIETVFNENRPQPLGDRWFNPVKLKVGAGFGQLYENFALPSPQTNKLEWRLGASARKTVGRGLSQQQTTTETGIEAFARYDQQVNKTTKFYAQYEGFSEFNDLAHSTNLITAGLVFQVTTYISAELGLRAWYETRPKEIDDTDPTKGLYNHWGIRQDALIGLVYNF